MIIPKNIIPANNPNIQYFGRWDFTDPLSPKHSWPGIYIYAEFTGTSIGIILQDHINYYNIYIDGKMKVVFHNENPDSIHFIIDDQLENSKHTILISKRNICFDQVFAFSGFILSDNCQLISPSPKPKRKIEFIGDSFTAAESNEATVQELDWESRYPVTNIDKGFAPIIAKHFNAQYITTCRSGSGMVCDWQGNFEVSIPKFFDRTLMEKSEPKWDFSKWIPDLVVICLGLNDFSGLKDSLENVSDEKSLLFRKGYHDFIVAIRIAYPNVKLLAVAAFPDWIRKNVRLIVDEELTAGHRDIFYSQFDYFPGGYVANGHPTVETHKKIAEQIIASIRNISLYKD